MPRKPRSKTNRPQKRKLRTETLEVRRCLAASLGWDGPGQGSTELSYYIGNAPSTIDQASFESAIETALNVWSDVVDIQFTETSRPGQRDSLDFKAANIDGSGGTLAQAYLPDDVNPARIAGDVEFDNSESWEIGNAAGRRAFDLVQVAVHEIGHALGIDHIHDSGSVLAPFVSPTQSFSQLSDHDIEAALELYAPAVAEAANSNDSTHVDDSVDTPVETDQTHEHDEPEVSNELDDATGEPEVTMEEDSPETNRDWRPWRRVWRFFGFWRRFGGRIIASPANHNAIQPSDVNGDGTVSPFDALVGINYMNNPNEMETGAVDTNGDGEVTPMDILNVLNDLHKQTLGQPMRPGLIDTFDAQGEGDVNEVGMDDSLNDDIDSDIDMMNDDPSDETPGDETTVNEEADIESTESEESDENPEESPVGETPVEDQPVDEETVDDPVGEDNAETADDETPSEEPPPEDETTGETSSEETPTEETSDENPTTTVGVETPNETDDTPSETTNEETGANETPSDDSTDETPAEENNNDDEVPTEDGSSGDHDDSCPVGWGLSRLFGIVDENNDGEVTEAEAGTGIWMIVSAADADGSGTVSLSELEAFRPDRATRQFMRLDDNGDGLITQDEVNENIWDRISPADTNDDGVSQEELTAYRESLPPRRFRRLDDNGDGVITQSEVNSRIWNRLVEHDTNEDGSITPDEFPESSRPRFRFGRPFRIPRFVGFGFRFR